MTTYPKPLNHRKVIGGVMTPPYNYFDRRFYV